MTEPVRVAVTGAAGQIAYSLLFRIASGEMLGPDQPVILQLLDIPPAMKACEGVMMELDDCAFPLLAGMEASDDPNVAFKDAGVAVLVGAKPRGPGMLRKDLLRENGPIFTGQGQALNAHAKRDVKVCVVGNPANTNCYIAMKNAPDLDASCFSALVRLDQNRALSQIASKTGKAVTEISKMTIWGNHSATQYPDVFHAEIGGQSVASIVNDQSWIEETFIPTVAAARQGHHRGPGQVLGGVGGQRGHRPRARVGARNPGRRLGLDGRALRRELRHPEGPALRLPGHVLGWLLQHRAGPRDRRLQPRQDGRDGTGARRRGRGRRRPAALSAARETPGSPVWWSGRFRAAVTQQPARRHRAPRCPRTPPHGWPHPARASSRPGGFASGSRSRPQPPRGRRGRGGSCRKGRRPGRSP